MDELIADNPETEDRLGFAPMAEILVNVIGATPPPFTIGVFGAWGSGKTTLMNLVRKGLDANGTKTVWFNAWKYDGKEVIWNALIQAIFYRMKSDPDMAPKGDFLERVKNAAGRIAIFAAKVGTRFIPRQRGKGGGC
jgi:predicted KAP-like P-loop ATPase